MTCKFCNGNFKNNGGLVQHEKFCEKTFHLKDDIINSYVNDLLSLKDLVYLYNINEQKIFNYIKPYLRTKSEACKLARITKPTKFIVSDETKSKISKTRKEQVRLEPMKVHWIKKDFSYIEKLFYDKLIELEWNKKYQIVREMFFKGYYIDFAFVDYKIAVELDGVQHKLEKQMISDAIKDCLLVDDGWLVLRFTSKEVIDNLDNIFEVLISKLSRINVAEVLRFGIYKTEKEQIIRLENGLTVNQQNDFLNRRKVIRPSLEELEQSINSFGKSATGVKYGVTHSTIYRWLKFYKKYNF